MLEEKSVLIKIGVYMRIKHRNVLSLLEDRTNQYLDRVALGIRTQMGWKEFTFRGLGLLSRKLASYLIGDINIQKGDKLAILSESKPEYGACVFASILSGMTAVPLDIKLTTYELTSILTDCKPVVMLVSQKYIDTAKELQKNIPSIKYILVMDEPSYNLDLKSIYELPENYDAKWRKRSANETVFVIYTSGTTGSPKGVEITFKNMLSQLDDIKDALNKIMPWDKCSILSILPMNHLFEMTVGFATFLNSGFSVYYTQSLKPKDILAIMRAKQINFMIVVPAFLKLLKATIESDLHSLPEKEQQAFKLKYHIAKFIPCARIKKLMFKDIHAKFGGHFNGCMSGGAPLDINVGKFFERIGIKVYQAYGLSETSPIISINTDKRHEIASVGRPLKSYKTKIDKQTGELLVKGPSVMKGYHNQPQLTNEVIDKDGWLHTGDIAKFDKDGHLFITGRIKNLIVLSGGKKVFPEEVEATLEKSPYFKEVCVLGYTKTFGNKDGTEEITAVVVPNEDLVNQYEDKALEKLIKDEVKALSRQLAAYKRPVNVIISKTDLPRTATRKVKRKEVKELVNV